MNLVRFLTIGSIFAILLGEFGKYPFGSSSGAVGVMDLLLAGAITFLVIWQIGIKKVITLPLLFKIIILFWGVGLLSLLISGNLTGGLYLLRFILYSSALWLGFNLIKSGNLLLTTLLKFIVAVGVGVALIGFLQVLLYPNIENLSAFGYDPHRGRLVSIFLDPNFTGSFFSICLMIAIYLYLRLKDNRLFIVMTILLAAIILTFSRSAYLMVGIELLLFSIFRSRKLLIGMIIAVLLLYVGVPRFAERINGALFVDRSASERFGSWQNGLVVFQQNPVFGVGFNNLRSVFEREDLFKVFSADGGHSGAGIDSSILFILATTGVVGGSVFLFFLTLLFKSLILTLEGKRNKDYSLILLCILVGLLINSQFINSLFFPPVMLVLYLLVGSWEAEKS